MAGIKLFNMGRAPLKESLSPSSVGKEKPSPYAYEHKVNLNAEDLSKLGVDSPKVGDQFHVMAHGHVTSVDETSAENGKKSVNVGLQLKRMGLRQKQGKSDSMLGAVSKGIADAKSE